MTLHKIVSTVLLLLFRLTSWLNVLLLFVVKLAGFIVVSLVRSDNAERSVLCDANISVAFHASGVVVVAAEYSISPVCIRDVVSCMGWARAYTTTVAASTMT